MLNLNNNNNNNNNVVIIIIIIIIIHEQCYILKHCISGTAILGLKLNMIV